MLVIFIAILIAPIIPLFHFFSQWFKTCWQQQPSAKQQLAYSLFHNQESFIYLHHHSVSPWELMETFFSLKCTTRRGWAGRQWSTRAPQILCSLVTHTCPALVAKSFKLNVCKNREFIFHFLKSLLKKLCVCRLWAASADSVEVQDSVVKYCLHNSCSYRGYCLALYKRIIVCRPGSVQSGLLWTVVVIWPLWSVG